MTVKKKKGPRKTPKKRAILLSKVSSEGPSLRDIPEVLTATEYRLPPPFQAERIAKGTTEKMTPGNLGVYL
jgi:hypothetical protein